VSIKAALEILENEEVDLVSCHQHRPDAAAIDCVCVEAFVHALTHEAPRLARVDRIEREPTALLDGTGFRIVGSKTGAVHKGVVPDAATCAACLQEVLDPFARRFRYPFTNCTLCGPRLSIVESIPYDRGATTMRWLHNVPGLCRRIRRGRGPALPRPTDRLFCVWGGRCARTRGSRGDRDRCVEHARRGRRGMHPAAAGFAHEPAHDHGQTHHGTTVTLEQQVLAKNQLLAERNRGWIVSCNLLALNLVSAP
jgi:hypothetical protein